MSEATPKPWRLEALRGYIAGPDGKTIVDCCSPVIGDGDPDQANAELVVHAVNNIDRITAERDGLKALLIRARDHIDLFSEPCSFLGPNLVKEIDAALATSSDTDAEQTGV